MGDFPVDALPFVTREQLDFGKEAKIELRLATQSDAAIKLAISGITKNNPFTLNQIPSNNSVLSVSTFRIDDIPILVSVNDAEGVLDQGQTFCRLSLVINGNVVQELCSGWVYTQKGLSWPFVEQKDLIPNGGFLGVETSTDPATDTEITISVPSGEMWRIIGGQFALVTDANAGDRRVHLKFRFDSAADIQSFSAVDHVASTTRVYSFAHYGAQLVDINDNDILIPIPKDIIVREGEIINTSTVNRKTGDNFGPMRIYVERFFTPA